MTINDTHEALTELCEAMKGRKTLRVQFKDIDDSSIGQFYMLYDIAKQMDALLEECYAGFKNEGMYDYYTKLEKAGYGQ